MSQSEGNSQLSAPYESSKSVATSNSAQQMWKIASLEEKLQVLEAGHAVKQSIEDLIVENDRRCDIGDDEVTIEIICKWDITLNSILLWFHAKSSDMEHEDYVQMLKKLRQGADSARGDDTSKLKSLVPDWVNREFKPNQPVNHEDNIRAGIRDCADGHIITEMSWPTFLYEKYTADQNNLKAFKAIFTSPSCAKEADSDSNGTNVIENNRRTKKDFSEEKVKTHVVQIIKMHKVSPCSITYVVCQFWCNVVDFFKRAPGRAKLTNSLRGGQGRFLEQVVTQNSVMQPSPTCP
ncbi:hypothetical protein BD769DRAFT_1391505 [Suillus cothurnatus]|nr:hypothetical protein BD769DRAFT_1391505 [Suillus cothurnatus]